MTKDASPGLRSLLDRLYRRRDFIKLFGKGLGYTAVASALPACGGGGGGNDPGQAAPAAVIPAASPDYTVLKRTSFGVHRDALGEIQALGIDAYLEQQLDYTQIDDGTLEADIQALFPLTGKSPAQLIGCRAIPADVQPTAVI